MKKKILLSGIAAACLAFLIGAILMITGFVTEKSVKWTGPTEIEITIIDGHGGADEINVRTTLKTEESGMYNIYEEAWNQTILGEEYLFPMEDVRNQAYNDIQTELEKTEFDIISYTDFEINGERHSFVSADTSEYDNELSEGIKIYLEENVSENQIVYPSFGMQWTEIVLGSLLMIGGIATVIALPIVSKKIKQKA